MAERISVGSWVYCPSGQGYEHEGSGENYSGTVSQHKMHFDENSVGILKKYINDKATVWLIGCDRQWDVPASDIVEVDLDQTGDKFPKKICNICHCLLPTEQFDKNQNNKKGSVRRPSCKQCRTDIDKRAPKSQQAKQFEKSRPQKGDPFQCPICRKWSIAKITAKIVADHNHHTGDIRDFICESCNTGLGRFKNGKNYLSNAIAYLEDRGGQ